MKVPVRHISFLPAAGMALFPFILVKKPGYRYDRLLINHEKIHIMQQKELLVIPFYLIYLLNYLMNLLVYRNHHTAYLNIVFEREAYSMERHTDYLKERRLYAWIRFFRKPN